MVTNLTIGTLIALVFASLFLVAWLYRPGSTAVYEEHSKIALKNDRSLPKKMRKKGNGKRKK